MLAKRKRVRWKTNLRNWKNIQAGGFNYEISSDQSSLYAQLCRCCNAWSFPGHTHCWICYGIVPATACEVHFVLVAILRPPWPTFIVMDLMGFSLNLMTLRRLSLVVGILLWMTASWYWKIFSGTWKRGRTNKVLPGRKKWDRFHCCCYHARGRGGIPANGAYRRTDRRYPEKVAVVVVVSTLMSLLVAFTLTPMMASVCQAWTT